MRIHYSFALAALACAPHLALASGLDIQVEIPRLNVAEYHRPYVAVWIERADGNVPASLAVWHDVNLEGDDGDKWLRELRQWWRRAGRTQAMPADGISRPTRPAGRHTLQFTEGTAPLPRLEAGSYKLVVEAAREAGDREVVALPFSWPPQKAERVQATGITELREVSLELKP